MESRALGQLVDGLKEPLRHPPTQIGGLNEDEIGDDAAEVLAPIDGDEIEPVRVRFFAISLRWPEEIQRGARV